MAKIVANLRPNIIRYTIRLIFLISGSFLLFISNQTVKATDIGVQNILNQNAVAMSTNNSSNNIMPLVATSITDSTDIASGTFGPVNWNIDASGRLSITNPTSNDLLLPQVDYSNNVFVGLPWVEYRNQITSVYVGEHLLANPKSNYLFSSLPNVTSIDISNLKTQYVTQMNYMFSNDPKLTAVKGLGTWDTPLLERAKYFFNLDSSLSSIDGLENWNTSNLTDVSNMFKGSGVKDISQIRGWNTSKLNNMASMFSSTSISDFSPIKNWDVSKVEDMSELFYSNKVVTSLDLSNWQTSSAISFARTFSGCTNLEQIIGLEDLDLNNVISIGYMFQQDNKMLSWDGVKNWDTSNINNMDYVFSGAFYGTSTKLDLSNWNTSKVISMAGMLNSNSGLNENTLSGLNKFDTRNVQDMTGMFSGTGFKKLDLSNFNTSKLNNMTSMFASTKQLEQIVGDFDTSSVTKMTNTFYQSNISDFTGFNIFDWNTSNVKNMEGMFRADSSIKKLDLSKWDTSNVQTFYIMFSEMKGLETLDISNFNMTTATNVTRMFSTTPNLWKISLGPKTILKLPDRVVTGYDNIAQLADPIAGSIINGTTINKTSAAISDRWQEVDSNDGGTDFEPAGDLISAQEIMNRYSTMGGPKETYVWQQQPKVDMKMSVPDIDFGETYDSAGLVKRSTPFAISVMNNSYPTDAIPVTIDVSLDHPLTDVDDSSKTLNDVLIFKDQDNVEKVLSSSDTEIYNGDIANGSNDLSWDDDHGILLNMNNDHFAKNGHYTTTLKWTLTNSI